MPRRLRDVAGTAAVLLMLFTLLMVFAPKVRERVIGGGRGQWLEPGRYMSDVMASAGATAMSYTTDHSYMVFFLIVAGVLFLLMLRT